MEDKKVTSAKTHILVEQYANQVLDFSSQYGSDMTFSYTAANCLGRPMKFPAYGDFPETFVMKEYGPWWELSPSRKMFPKNNASSCDHKSSYDNFIDLKFDHSVYVYAVYVYETFNPGAITGIFGGNCKGSWKKLWSGAVQKAGHKPRLDSFLIPKILLSFSQEIL